MNNEEKKITVKHYLNKRAKVKLFNNEEFYPLYIQIIVAGKKAQIKSKINEHLKIYKSDLNRLTHNQYDFNDLILSGYFSKNLLDEIDAEKNFPVSYLLQDEIDVITEIIRLQQPFDNEYFSLSSFSFEYQKYTTEISQTLDRKIKETYRAELKSIFLKSIDEEETKDIFKISNFLIHFINWENSFSTFYDSTYEILPSEFKRIENLLSKELRASIKAFMSFHTKINVLNRFFEKRELGKISTLSYLDWQTNVKDFLQDEFTKLFGEQKACEYILVLDNILTEAINEKETE